MGQYSRVFCGNYFKLSFIFILLKFIFTLRLDMWLILAEAKNGAGMALEMICFLMALTVHNYGQVFLLVEFYKQFL